MVMIIHRTTRDVARCRRKYGEAWTRYEKAVPYLFIPVSRPESLFLNDKISDIIVVRHLRRRRLSNLPVPVRAAVRATALATSVSVELCIDCAWRLVSICRIERYTKQGNLECYRLPLKSEIRSSRSTQSEPSSATVETSTRDIAAHSPKSTIDRLKVTCNRY